MENMNDKMVIGIGEFLFDLLPAGKQAGGAPVNFAYNAAGSGVRAYAISAVGNDALGEELVGIATDRGIRLIAPVVEHPTGTVDVSLDENGVPTFIIRENVAWDYIPCTREMETLAADADAVCFGTLSQRNPVSRNTIRRLLSLCKPSAMKVFDINLRQDFYSMPLIEESLELSDVLKINDDELEELRRMTGLQEPDTETLCRKLISGYGLSMLILTAGSKFSSVYTADGGCSTLPTPHVDVVDTVGAGDAFTGTFIASVLNGMPVKEAHRRAVDVAAEVCTKPGAWI